VQQWWQSIKKQFSLQLEEDFDITYQEIYTGAQFQGHNLWILCIAMVIASIGLSTNSVTAIVGAMLISPLMGPVVGFAFGLAINDAPLKRMALRNWLLMTAVSLVSALLFFLVNPFVGYTDQIFAYSSATLFDILLAVFGGLAGFIGIIKKDGAKILAGVAVATACMPPLCAAADGLSKADWITFLGGFYFYFINCLFIGWASFLLARYLGFHKRNAHNITLKPVVKWLWYLIIVVMLLPGTYIAIQKWQQQKVNCFSNSKSTADRIDSLEQKMQHLDSMINSLRLKAQ
jgi:uncharacterized hydrophobic protein (TIGR00271 family)